MRDSSCSGSCVPGGSSKLPTRAGKVPKRGSLNPIAPKMKTSFYVGVGVTVVLVLLFFFIGFKHSTLHEDTGSVDMRSRLEELRARR